MFLYQIQSRGDDSCSLTKCVREHIKSTWLCEGCRVPKDGIKCVDIEIQSLLKKPVYYVLAGGISLIRNDLVAALGTDIVNEYCYLGTVYKGNKTINNNYSTIRGKYAVCIRGNNESTVKICEKCNRSMYFAEGDKYIVDAPANVPILGCSHNARILVNETIYQKLLPLNIAQLEIVKIPVLDAPHDNISEFRGYITR